MFVIGMELDLGVIRRKASETLVISHASIIVPFLMGMGLAYVVYPEFGARHASFRAFRAVRGHLGQHYGVSGAGADRSRRNLSKTPMGMLAIASAANNDVTAWCLLAAVIAVAGRQRDQRVFHHRADGAVYFVHVLPGQAFPAQDRGVFITNRRRSAKRWSPLFFWC